MSDTLRPNQGMLELDAPQGFDGVDIELSWDFSIASFVEGISLILTDVIFIFGGDPTTCTTITR